MQICKVDFAIFSQKATKKRPFDRFFHSFTHSLIHSLIHSFTHSLIHSLIHSFIHSFTHSFPTPPGPDDKDIKAHNRHYTGNDVP